MKKGFAVVSVILVIVALLVVGGGGYMGYRYFTEPDFDFYGLVDRGPSAEEVTAKYPVISADLLDHVQGANADLLLFYRRDDALLDYLVPLIDVSKANPAIHVPAFIDPSDVRAVMVAFRMVFPEDLVLDESSLNDPESLIDTMGAIVAIDFESNAVAENVSTMALPLAAFIP